MIMTPEDFWLKICTIETKYDSCEMTHIKMDELMCELLKELGYEKGVEVFERAPKWYS